MLHPALNSWNHVFQCFSGTLEILFFHRDLPSLGDLVEQFRLLVQRHGLQTHPFVKPPTKKSLRKEDDDNLMKWFSTWNKLGNISSLYYIYTYISSLYERLGEILYNAMICHGSIKCASVMVWKRPLRSPMPQAALQSSHPMSKNCKTPIFWGCLNHLISRWPANGQFL